MSSSSISTEDGANQSAPNPMDRLLNGLLLAHLLQSVVEPDASPNESAQQAPSNAAPGMPVPLTMPQPTLPSGQIHMPEPQVRIPTIILSNGRSIISPTSCMRNTRNQQRTWPVCPALPGAVSGDISYLKLDGYGARNSVENMCALLQFLLDNRWEAQGVDKFINTMRGQPHWPAKLKDKPHSAHVDYAWMLMNGLLAVIGLKPYLDPTPPATFAGVVQRIFPPPPPGPVPPQRFTFTARELIEEDFTIQPTTNLLDHLKLIGNAVNVYSLSSEEIQLLMGYNNNRAARAIGMASLGVEIMHSYAALVEGEFHECYRLPISLGIFKIDDERTKRGEYDDLTVVTGVIRMYRNDPAGDRTPRVGLPSNSSHAAVAARVVAIEAALRRLRHWYNRLRRDIHKRKKEEPWMFWGAVLAVFFGICTVIQTVTSVWSLVASLS
ncbi:hypothetical protein BN946_scf184803.g4 [Trametes cinnabarina]|uniref:Uncharacterized protein n=1 Tax=Pycnoporus cinnabarinus TaxID=5643 RepID=A0A060S6K8_PYCCI|nr:hypothetical protein BN946_scf184803.g4 [Trametes cinnabarina]